MSGPEHSRSFLAVSAVDSAAASKLGLDLACVAAVTGPLVEVREGGAEAVAYPADTVLAWVALSSAGAVEVDQLARSLAGATGRRPPVLDISSMATSEHPLALARARAAQLEVALAEARAFTVQLSASLAVLRREHQVLLDRYLQVETRVAPILAAGRLVCDIAPAGDPAILGTGSALGERASMLLPFNISGLSRLELSIAHVSTDARLRLSVEGLEAGEELLEWRRSAADLAPGWIALTVPTALLESPGSGRLWVEVEAGVVTVDTGAPHPLPDLRIVSESGSGEGPLALRAWTSVPGFSVGEPLTGSRGG